MIYFPLSVVRGEGRCTEVWVVVLTAVGGGGYLEEVTHPAWARGRGTAEGPCRSHGQRGLQPPASVAREEEGPVTAGRQIGVGEGWEEPSRDQVGMGQDQQVFLPGSASSVFLWGLSSQSTPAPARRPRHGHVFNPSVSGCWSCALNVCPCLTVMFLCNSTVRNACPDLPDPSRLSSCPACPHPPSRSSPGACESGPGAAPTPSLSIHWCSSW